MPRYSVTCTKPVTDYLRATVEVEADDPEQAEERALALAGDKDLYQFSHCGDSLEAVICDVTQIEPLPSKSATPYRLGSSPMISAPGIIAWAINHYRSDPAYFGGLVAQGWHIPPDAAHALLSGAAPHTIDGEAVVFAHTP